LFGARKTAPKRVHIVLTLEDLIRETRYRLCYWMSKKPKEGVCYLGKVQMMNTDLLFKLRIVICFQTLWHEGFEEFDRGLHLVITVLLLYRRSS
jgi:hypothetical protein